MIKRLLALLSLGIFLFPSASFALDTPYNNLISDFDFTNSSAMSREGLQKFLSRKGVLHSTKAEDPWGKELTITDIIIDAAKYYRINPQVLVVTIQKEQSAITDTSLSDYQKNWMMGYGVCDSCSTEDPSVRKYKGAWKQINHAARRLREFMDNPGGFGIEAGTKKEIDGKKIRLKNAATGALYTYTPHLHGNENFYLLWQQWFAKALLEGTIVKEEGTNNYYFISQSRKRKFKSLGALVANYSLDQVLSAASSDLAKYEDGPAIHYPDGIAVMAPNGGVYLIVNGEKRGIASPKVLKRLGLQQEEIVQGSNDELQDVPSGPTITEKDLYPTTTLVQSRETGAIFQMENGKRRPIVSPVVLKNQFGKRRTTVVSEKELDAIPVGEPVKLRDGTLVRDKRGEHVYIISGGERRKILTGEAFSQYGFKWKNVITVDNRTLKIHPEGKTLK